MGIVVKRTGAVPVRAWDETAMRAVAIAARDAIVTRAFVRGHGLDDRPFKPDAEGKRADLIRSGRLMRSFRVTRVTAGVAQFGPTGEAARYAPFVSRARPFIGLSPADRRLIAAVVARAIAAALKRASVRR